MQVINITRGSTYPLHTTVIYYLERDGNLTEALDAVAVMNSFRVEELSIIFGHVVLLKAEGIVNVYYIIVKTLQSGKM